MSLLRFTLLVLAVCCRAGGSSDQANSETPGRFRVASVDFAHVSTPFIISLWIVIAGLAKIGFHVTPRISLICPESCLLIVIGVIIGFLLYYTGLKRVGPLTPDVFFLYMLPPIVLDAGYYMPNRLFFDNLVTISLFAVMGTVFNALSVGLSLYGLGLTGVYQVDFNLLDALRFGAIACAVDPVAVLAVFEEIHVNDVLYIVVFGESLLNDAVTVVLYHMFDEYGRMGSENILPVDYVAGVSSFFVVAVCGTLVGIVWGYLAAFVSRFTHHVRVVEPLFVFVVSYLAYVSAELFHLSGILALTFCGITMKNYVEENISYKSHVTVKYTMKMLASCSETVIFLFLGVSTVNDNHDWNTWFVVATVFFCTFYRVVGVALLTAVANHFRLHRLNKVEQFILAYGGLRGAVAFALILIVDDKVSTKNMMVTTIIALVYFTVFVQGMTIGPLVRLLNVPTSSKVKPTMNERIHTRLIDHVMAGIEDIAGQIMGNYHLRDKFKYYNNKYLRPLLLREHVVAEPKIFETYSKLNIADAMNMVNNVSLPTNDHRSLAELFRTYTQANLEAGSAGGPRPALTDHSPCRPGFDFLNVDMAELNYSPSYKDLADAQLHHILSDAMFKPPRRFRKYSRDHIPDGRSRPPFQHQVRMQIRHLVSEGNRHRARTQTDDYFHPNNNNNNSRPYSQHGGLDAPSHHGSKEMKETEGSPDRGSIKSHQSESSSSPSHEDDGIVFRVHSPSESPDSETSKQTLPDQTVLTPVSPTVTETTLPWKRLEETVEDDCARIQREFPSWIDNREYTSYHSPTSTLLSKLDDSEDRRPAVFEIFGLDASPARGAPTRDQEAEAVGPDPADTGTGHVEQRTKL